MPFAGSSAIAPRSASTRWPRVTRSTIRSRTTSTIRPPPLTCSRRAVTSPATIKSGQTPCVIDWEYNNAAQTNVLKGTIDWKVTIPSDAPPVAAYYIQAINKDAPHPAAARLWEEYLYSPDGSNEWIRGFARPATLAAMQANGTVDATALGALSQTSGTPVVLTEDQITKGQNALKSSWTFITIK